MGFSYKDTTTPLPTHMKFISNNPIEIGNLWEISLILLNPEWKAITFFTDSFKYNIKCQTDEAFCDTRDEIYKSLKRGYCVANISDTSSVEPKKFEVEIELESCPESKGGRKYSLAKNRISIEPSSKSIGEDKKSKETP